MKRKLLVLLSVFCVCLLVLSACSLLPTVTEDDPKAPVTTKYTLSFNSNGGSGSMDSVSAEAGTQITLPHCTYTRADHTFVGWGWDYNDEACLSDGDSFTFEAQNTVLYAIWEENRQMFTLVFDANGGEGTMQNVQFAESVRLPECSFTRTGYDFVGWALSASSTSADYNAGDVFYRLGNQSTTLYAIWAPKTFTISFNTDGGSAVAPITAEYGATVTAPAVPTKSGYDFAGWSPAFPSTMPAENITLTAQWTPKRYTITFNTNGGSSVSSVTYNYGAKITAPTAPTKTGHTFAGWSPALPSTMPAENLNVTAQWTVNEYTITFNANGGQGTMSAQNIQTGIDVTINSCLFTREGYSFSGWSTQSSGEVEYADCATATFAKSTTLYAIWREKGEEDKIAECISAIADLGTSDFDANAVASARAMFNALPSNNARSKVTNYPALLDAEYHIATDAAYEAAKDDVQGVIKAVAYSYYNQTSSGNVQAYYDQYNSRRNFNPIPEDATPEKALYIDCSSFVNAVYYYTFNSNLLPVGTAINTSNVNKALAAITDKGTEYELLYYVKTPPKTVKSADRAAMIADIKANLQVGDVYNYYHGTGGHIMLYIGDGKFMHCTGSANKSTSAGGVDPATSVEQGTTDENKLGSVMIDSWDIVFTSTATPKSTDPTKTGTGNRYLFGDTMTSFGFFRPTNKTNGRFKDTPITQRALTRYVYNGLTFEKVCNKAFSSSVLVGDELTYTLTLKNLSANAQGLINVAEPLPAGVEFVSANEGGVYNSTTNTIYWQFSGLDANSSKSIVYKFKVSSDTKVGTLINDNGTTVNGLLANSTQQTVASRKLTESDLSNAVSALSSQTFDVDLDAAKALYAELGLKVFSETSAASFSAVLGQVLSSFKPAKSNKMYNYVVPALYGGFSVGSTEYTSTLSNSKYQDYNYRARLVKTSFLEVGDIIVTRSGWTADINAGTDYKMFIYASSSTVYGLTADGHLAKVSLPIAKVSLPNEELATYLQTLTAYKVFAVFRPIISTSAKAI